jgi:uncharacterized membrane protein
MTWRLLFRLRQYVRVSLWVFPVAGGVAGSLLALAVSRTGTLVELSRAWTYSSGTAETVLAAVVGASVGLTGFVVTVSVLIVQMATGTFSARYMRLFYRDGVLKAVLSVLVGTLTFSYSLLRRVEQDAVPSFGVTLAGLFLAIGLLLFLVFLDRSIHRLRPVAVAAFVARAGRRSHEELVQNALAPDAPDYLPRELAVVGAPAVVVRSDHAGAIQAIDAAGLTRFARKHRCLVVMRKVVGDFVPEGATVFEVYDGDGLGADAERNLRSMVVLGVERTIEQDPAFAIRVMVDIAIRALSPAVNDPTTAVQVLDHLGDTLRLMGNTPSGVARTRAPEEAGPGVVVRTRRWEDVVALATTEIREYGSRSVQVMRRLRAMLEELRDSVLPEHRAAVEDELARLDATVSAHWSDSVDLDRARSSDRQGIGGPTAAGESS